LLRAWLKWRYRTELTWLASHAPSKYVMPPYDGWRRRLGLESRNGGLPGSISFDDVKCFRPPVPSTTPEEAFAFLLSDQQRVSPTLRSSVGSAVERPVSRAH
jgi:hypothetical protein